MKKIILGLAALAALSSAALASERTDIDPRDRWNNYGTSVVLSESAAFATIDNGRDLTNFERVTMQSAENENGGN